MRLTRPVAAVACLAAVTALATGCRDDQQSGASGGSGKSGGSGGGAHQSPHKGVDADSGKTLALGTTTRVHYKRPGKSAVLDVTVKKVTKGSRAEMKEANLSPAELAKQPYYITVTYHNPGKKKVTFPDTPVGLQAPGGGADKRVITASDEVKKCPRTVESNEVKPGEKRTNCNVHLLPAGKSAKTASYRMNMDKHPVFWKAKP